MQTLTLTQALLLEGPCAVLLLSFYEMQNRTTDEHLRYKLLEDVPTIVLYSTLSFDLHQLILFDLLARIYRDLFDLY